MMITLNANAVNTPFLTFVCVVAVDARSCVTVLASVHPPRPTQADVRGVGVEQTGRGLGRSVRQLLSVAQPEIPPRCSY